jgi:hypothetical protein
MQISIMLVHISSKIEHYACGTLVQKGLFSNLIINGTLYISRDFLFHKCTVSKQHATDVLIKCYARIKVYLTAA